MSESDKPMNSLFRNVIGGKNMSYFIRYCIKTGCFIKYLCGSNKYFFCQLERI